MSSDSFSSPPRHHPPRCPADLQSNHEPREWPRRWARQVQTDFLLTPALTPGDLAFFCYQQHSPQWPSKFMYMCSHACHFFWGGVGWGPASISCVQLILFLFACLSTGFQLIGRGWLTRSQMKRPGGHENHRPFGYDQVGGTQ